jgi:hypothetical protein
MKPKIAILLIGIAISTMTQQSVAATHYVATNGAHISPFSSWQNAATSINSAAYSSRNGGTVIVSNGTYFLTNTVPVYANMTLISVNGPSNTIIDGQNQVLCVELRSTPSTISGFTIQQGKGGSYGGGGIYADCDGTISNCIVVSNTAASKGGGIFSTVGQINIQDCVVNRNTAGEGGGICIEVAGSVINCVVMGNSARTGGGISIQDLNSGLIRNCLIAENYVSGYGAGGGAIIAGIVSVENCTIYNNSNYFGGLYFESFVGFPGSSPPTTRYTVVNTICYSNVTPSPDGFSNCETGRTDTTFSYCDISPAPTGIGNFDADPKLANVQMGNYSLSGDSPCIDAGRNLSWISTGIDLDGTARVFGNSVDIGAYEASISTHGICSTGAVDTIWSVPVGATVKLSSSTNLRDPLWSEVGIYTSETHTISIPDMNSEAPHKFYKLHWLQE